MTSTEARQSKPSTTPLTDQEYEIDLSEKNAASFYAAIQPYIDKSRKLELPVITPRRTTRRSTTPGATKGDSAQVRAWATARGIEVNPRGRIKKEILEQYQADMSGQLTQSAPAQSTPASNKRNGQDPASEQTA